MGSIGAASTEFCIDVFRELRVQHVNENIFYSPLSIISALSMVYLGARENTRAQIDEVFHFDKITGFGDTVDPQCGASLSVHKSLQNVFAQITQPKDNYSLNLASRLYAEESYPILPEYIQCVKELYNEGLETVSFQTGADQARELINSWVENQTNGKSKPSISIGIFPSITTFEQHMRIPVQMMYQFGSFKVAVVASEKIKILELPYASGQLSMWVLLPDEVSGLEQLENAITFEKLTEWTSSDLTEERKIKVFLPRVKIEEKYNLTAVLMALGVTDLFSSSANFSGISAAENLKMSEAVHEAFVEIYEAGSEVVGSSGAGIEAPSDSEEFRADHPFLFLIKHNPTNSILFFGRCFSP
uniref:Uncharacterized protein n=1 Tax=Melopsittacus undulatus TaxID=13146 RepID=A0A8V5FNM5_MELUD